MAGCRFDKFNGARLPYVDNLVNLLVAEDRGAVPLDEIMRVLCPGGVAYVGHRGEAVVGGGEWTKTVKQRPQAIDQWTHFLYNATNNAVSKDAVVGPPRQLQWVGGPKWTRTHDHMASVSAVVSSGGRIFYIVDEAPTAAVILQPQWSLVARDAFNGTILWKRPISNWPWHLRGFRSGPSDLARKLVAMNDRVYVTLDLGGPLAALDAATGRTVATYQGTEGALEVVLSDGTLYVVAGTAAPEQAAAKAPRQNVRPGLTEVRTQRPEYLEQPSLKRLAAIDAATGLYALEQVGRRDRRIDAHRASRQRRPRLLPEPRPNPLPGCTLRRRSVANRSARQPQPAHLVGAHAGDLRRRGALRRPRRGRPEEARHRSRAEGRVAGH